MDVASKAQYLVTGHDKSLCLWKLPGFERVWEKRVTVGQQGGGMQQAQLRVIIDEYASVVVSSSTSKRVTIYEAKTGQPLCRCQPGQITTAMCFTNNMKHLITTCDNGLIFFWRLPDKLVTKLQLIKTENKRIEEASQRAPTVIEEAPEQEENDSRPASVAASPLISRAKLSEERKGESS